MRDTVVAHRARTVLCAIQVVNHILHLSDKLVVGVDGAPLVSVSAIVLLTGLLDGLNQSADIAETEGEGLQAAGIIGNLRHVVGH